MIADEGIETADANRPGGGGVRRTLLVLAVVLPLGMSPLTACGWFGGGELPPQPQAGPAASSDEILQKDCNDENWKKQNLGLWYSVCRQPMRW
jgi:predicted small lipoprotein YifL